MERHIMINSLRRKNMLPLSVRILLFFIGVTFTAATAFAEESEVMVMGVFHFANPGRDLVKTDQINVMSEPSQSYLQELTQRISEFQPTHVLLECEAHEWPEFQGRYQEYLNDNFELSANELHQLGFRIARLSGLSEITCYDDMSAIWKIEPLFEFMNENDPQSMAAMNSAIADVTSRVEENHKTLSLRELLKIANSPEEDRLNKDLYLLTNSVGAGDNWVGADASASWWQRNFRMYGNIQQVAAPDTRVLVIGGQGHTAIFRDFLQIDGERKAVDIIPFL